MEEFESARLKAAQQGHDPKVVAWEIEAARLYAAGDATVDEAIEHFGQIPDNVRHMRRAVIRMLARYLAEMAGDA